MNSSADCVPWPRLPAPSLPQHQSWPAVVTQAVPSWSTAVAAPGNEVTLVSAAGNTLAVPSTLTGGVGNFSVGWDASA